MPPRSMAGRTLLHPSVSLLGGLGVSAALAIACGGCEVEQTAAARAANVAQIQCSDPRTSSDEARVLGDTRILKVVPWTFRAGSDVRSDGMVRVQGVKLVVRPPDGVTLDEMTRILQCHSAKALLGRVDLPPLPGDPYVLPDAWLDIDVVTEHGAVVVKESADRVWQNLALLKRATAFADEHRPPPPR
jgi:hypothetical protein